MRLSVKRTQRLEDSKISLTLVKMMNEPKTVLIIDDDSDYVRANQALLESSGYKVRSASNGRDGLQLAKTLQPD